MSEPATELPTRAAARRERHAVAQRPWWGGDASVQRWREDVISVALVGMGIGMLLNGWLGGWAGTAGLWAGLLVPVAYAFWRGVPRGLLRFHGFDIVYALSLGVLLRLAQGWLELAFGGTGQWPSYPTLDGSLPESQLWETAGVVVAAPLVEELFFRAVVLVGVFVLVRRLVERTDASGRAVVIVAGSVALAASVALFVFVHVAFMPLPADGVIAIALVGIVCAVLVLTTGRIWGAVLTHIVYNAAGAALAYVGTLFG